MTIISYFYKNMEDLSFQWINMNDALLFLIILD
jgi:hypothetical protein